MQGIHDAITGLGQPECCGCHLRPCNARCDLLERHITGDILRAILAGEDIGSGKQVVKTVELPLGRQNGNGAERLAKQAGLVFRTDDDKIYVDDVVFGGYAEKQQIDFDCELTSLQVPAQRPPKELFYLPALLLLGLVCCLQRGRRVPEAASGVSRT